MTAVPRRRPAKPKGPDLASLAEKFRKYRQLRNAESLAKSEHEKMRDEDFMPVLEKVGVAHGEHGQHQAIELPEPIDGFVRLVRRANVSRYINVDKAEELAQHRGFLEDIQSGTVSFTFTGTPAEAHKLAERLREQGAEEFAPIHESVAFDQDRLMAFHQQHRAPEAPRGKGAMRYITEAELDGLFEEDTRYSFFPEKS